MPIKCVVPISGGKDSQLCLELAIEHFKPDEILALFCDTQFEHPITYAHVANMMRWYNVKFDTICMGDVLSKCEKYGRFPSGIARFCTDELKITPSKVYYSHLADKQGCGFEVWYGMRLNESPERSVRYSGKISSELYPPHEFMKKFPKYLYKKGVVFRLPIAELSSSDVLHELGDRKNPLYDEDFERVGCFPCLASGDKWMEKAFNFDDFGRSQYEKAKQTAQKIRKNIYQGKKALARNGCAFCSI